MAIACFEPIILVACGLPIALALVVGIITQLGYLANRILSKHISEMVILVAGIALLGISTLPWFYEDQINDALIKYAIARYDPVIDAIEKYHADNGEYPPTLDVLVPKYLPAVPGIYMKFGETMTYESTPSAWFDHAPFTFEMYGHYAGIHGQMLKYCPATLNPCFESDRHIWASRINERWVWIYSSAL